MILIKSSRLVYLFGILLIICIPLMNHLSGDSPGKGEAVVEDNISKIVPFFIIIELLVYFFFGLLSGSGSSIYNLIQYCLMIFFFRLLCCSLALMIFSNYSQTLSLNALLYFWMGNPLLVLIQVFLLMMFGPHLAWIISPRLISDKALAFVGERRVSPDHRAMQTVTSDVTPVGGFIRVYTFEELGRLFLNMMGIEGYILYSIEGLILWKDCQLRFDMDKLVAVSLMEWNQHRTAQQKIGFNEPERLISQTAEHNFVHVPFNQSFFGIFIFKRNADMDGVLNRLQPLARSACELLEMKYSPLI